MDSDQAIRPEEPAQRNRKAERFATVVTVGFAIWNVGIAFIAGFLLCLAARRGLLRL